MAEKKIIDPQTWDEFLADFSDRNSGRRARFEAFSRGRVAEEDEEGTFESVSIEKSVATVKRRTASGNEIEDRLEDVHGISIQYDTDDSENTIEFMDTNGDLTVLHFESMVDGES